MIAYIQGPLISVSDTHAIIETGGIGYEIFIPQNIKTKLPPIGEKGMLFTSFIIRENSQTLFGFLDQGSKLIFEGLLNISGVGPKMALALIGNLSIDQLQRAICEEDVAILKKVPGVGKKTAERLIVDLKDKLPSLFPRDLITLSSSTGTEQQQPKSALFHDAVSALINLGYQQYQAKRAVQIAFEENGSSVDPLLPELITQALAQTQK